MQSTADALTSIVRSRRFWWWLRTIILFLVLLIAVRSSCIDLNLVPSDSMLPTLIAGDHIVVNKLAFDLKIPLTHWHLCRWSDPKRGDVIVFDSPRDGLRLVKRVVAIGGDQVCMVGDRLIINGETCGYADNHGERIETAAGQSRMVNLTLGIGVASANFLPITIPAESFFVLGDNRDGCIDSRNFGPVQRNAIIGRVSTVAYSQGPSQWLTSRRDRLWIKIK